MLVMSMNVEAETKTCEKFVLFVVFVTRAMFCICFEVCSSVYWFCLFLFCLSFVHSLLVKHIGHRFGATLAARTLSLSFVILCDLSPCSSYSSFAVKKKYIRTHNPAGQNPIKRDCVLQKLGKDRESETVCDN